MAEPRIYVTDDNGKKLTPNDAAALLGTKENNIRHYIRTREARTIDDIKEVIANLKKSKAFYVDEPTHETIFGPLTVRQMLNLHPYKEQVSLAALRTRVSQRGSLNCAVWGTHRFCDEPKTEVCSCGRKLTAKHFAFIKSGISVKCTTRKTTVQTNKKIVLNVKPGEEVVSDGLLYRVVECKENGKYKGLVTGNRKMPNGDVLVNTTRYLLTNWSEVIA